MVSIIIPVFNRGDILKETLNSILMQSYKNWECILVDDGSTDNTQVIIQNYLKKDNRFNYYKRLNNRVKGANACRNFGFEKSKGEFIQWFDSDDLMHENKLEKKLKYLKSSNFDFVVCQGIEYKDNIENVINKWDKISSGNVIFDHAVGNVSFHTNGPLFKKSFLEGKLLFNETLQRKQEWEFFSRLLIYSTNYKPLKKDLYYFRHHENSINGKNELGTLKSRIKSINLVYHGVKQFITKDDLYTLKNKFFDKYILLFKLAKKHKDIFLVLYAIKNVVLIIDFIFLIKKIIKLIKNPKLIYNVLK